MAHSKSDEQQRLEELKSYCILDTSSEAEFDEITRLISKICEVPIATVTLVDKNREWFKSAYGLKQVEGDRKTAFCARAIQSQDVYIVPDTLKDPAFADNPKVIGEPFIRFYAGVPLISPSGFAIGALAIKDLVPRELNSSQIQLLKAFANQVMVQLEFRRQRLALEREREFLAALLENLSEGIVACDAKGNISLFNRVTKELHGMPEEKLPPEQWATHYSLYMADGKTPMPKEQIPLYRALQGESINNETLVIAPKGQPHKLVLCNGQPILNAGGDKLGAVVAMRDITYQRSNEIELARLNRALRLLTSCNELLVRADDELELLRRLCKLIVEVGGYKMSWVGYAENDEYRSIKPIAHFGDFSHLRNIRLSWSDAVPEGNGPAGNTIRSGKPIVIEDLINHPDFAPWAESAKRNKFLGVVCLPLKNNGKTFGLLSMYAGEVRRIKEDETELLQELADDLALGIANLRNSERVQYLAYYDQLTSLPNRTLFLERLTDALAASSKNQHYNALIFIDIDNFKVLNDTQGHDRGDLLLKQLALRLKNLVGDSGTVARLGGDEFVVMLPSLSYDEASAKLECESFGKKLISSLEQPFQLGEHLHHSTPSIGIALFSDETENISELMKRADLAMYEAKSAGKNTFRFFNSKMQTAISERVSLESDLKASLYRHELTLNYQPQLDINGNVIGAEALIRWKHPDRGLVSPAIFIPIAEETGIILQIGDWVIKTACTQLARWAGNPKTSSLSLAVNVSVSQFRESEFVDSVLNMVDHFGVDPSKFKMELTESLFVENVEDIINKMKRLKERGINFSLDDFGTGYSSLAYLKKMPLDQLKIDQSFVRDVLVDSNDASIACSIINLAQSLGLEVIAEGVETEQQKDFLLKNKCYLYQGYLFGKPMSADEFDRYMGI